MGSEGEGEGSLVPDIPVPGPHDNIQPFLVKELHLFLYSHHPGTEVIYIYKRLIC